MILTYYEAYSTSRTKCLFLHWDKIDMNENPIFLLRSKKSFFKREICIVLLPFETSYLSCLI